MHLHPSVDPVQEQLGLLRHFAAQIRYSAAVRNLKPAARNQNSGVRNEAQNCSKRDQKRNGEAPIADGLGLYSSWPASDAQKGKTCPAMMTERYAMTNDNAAGLLLKAYEPDFPPGQNRKKQKG